MIDMQPHLESKFKKIFRSFYKGWDSFWTFIWPLSTILCICTGIVMVVILGFGQVMGSNDPKYLIWTGWNWSSIKYVLLMLLSLIVGNSNMKNMIKHFAKKAIEEDFREFVEHAQKSEIES